MITPVTETYNQIGKVIFAIFLCFCISDTQPLYRVNKAKGIIIAARTI